MNSAYEEGRRDALLTIQEAIQKEFPCSESPWYVERTELLQVLRSLSKLTGDNNWQDTDRLDKILTQQISCISKNFSVL